MSPTVELAHRDVAGICSATTWEVEMRIAAVKNWVRARVAIDNAIWASNKNVFKTWQKGDVIILLVGKDGVVVAEVSGAPFRSNVMFWDDDLFEHRIPIRVLQTFDSTIGQEVNASIRHVLFDWYRIYGWVILAQARIPDDLATRVSALLEQDNP